MPHAERQGADAQTRGAEEVGPPPGDSSSMPAWIPRLLLSVIIAVFAALAIAVGAIIVTKVTGKAETINLDN